MALGVQWEAFGKSRYESRAARLTLADQPLTLVEPHACASR